ncbi:hypothetical protein PCANC_18320 [Puccinia coronata f. sp. avenae]|uniref:Uncharacterized protein n=1 Tax=Puccinia coronata f. sp. avenae TaxID=200324 RepID=A0A2N5SGE8_9BASI|nr:hypothetical protein PCANC_18320 [Puccinia coronata f. sp. avenae]
MPHHSAADQGWDSVKLVSALAQLNTFNYVFGSHLLCLWRDGCSHSNDTEEVWQDPGNPPLNLLV